MKTEHVMDSTEYIGIESIKSENVEERIKLKNGYGMSSEEKIILSNIKEEEEEGGERHSKEVKREDGVKDKEVYGFEWKQEKEGDGQRKRDEIEQSPETDDGLKKERIPDCKPQEEEGLSCLVTSCLLKQPRIPSPGSLVISSGKENAGGEIFPAV